MTDSAIRVLEPPEGPTSRPVDVRLNDDGEGRQVVLLAPSDGGDVVAPATEGTVDAIRVAAESLAGQAHPETGVWDYDAGIAGTVVVPPGGRVLSFACLGGTSAGTISVNGGPDIPVPARTPVSVEPKGNLVAPTVVFTGTVSYVVEFVA